MHAAATAAESDEWRLGRVARLEPTCYVEIAKDPLSSCCLDTCSTLTYSRSQKTIVVPVRNLKHEFQELGSEAWVLHILNPEGFTLQPGA